MTGTSFSDDGAAPGTWYYRVTATDSVGNTSAGSDAVEAVVDLPGSTTTTTVPAAADTWVTDASPDANYGTSWVMQVRSGPTRVSYLRFELPDAPPGTSLSSAVLTVRTTDNSWSGSVRRRAGAPGRGRHVGRGGHHLQQCPLVGGGVIGTLPGGTASSTAYAIDLDVAPSPRSSAVPRPSR